MCQNKYLRLNVSLIIRAMLEVIILYLSLILASCSEGSGNYSLALPELCLVSIFFRVGKVELSVAGLNSFCSCRDRLVILHLKSIYNWNQQGEISSHAISCNTTSFIVTISIGAGAVPAFLVASFIPLHFKEILLPIWRLIVLSTGVVTFFTWGGWNAPS